MGFREDVLSDIDDVFFDPDEFAEMRDVNGTQMLCLVSRTGSKARSNDKSENFDGIYRGEVVLFIKAADLAKRPVRGQPLRIDGRLLMVEACVESAGILEIRLEANDS